MAGKTPGFTLRHRRHRHQSQQHCTTKQTRCHIQKPPLGNFLQIFSRTSRNRAQRHYPSGRAHRRRHPSSEPRTRAIGWHHSQPRHIAQCRRTRAQRHSGRRYSHPRKRRRRHPQSGARGHSQTHRRHRRIRISQKLPRL